MIKPIDERLHHLWPHALVKAIEDPGYSYLLRTRSGQMIQFSAVENPGGSIGADWITLVLEVGKNEDKDMEGYGRNFQIRLEDIEFVCDAFS